MDPLDSYRSLHSRMPLSFGPRRGQAFDVDDVLREAGSPLAPEDAGVLEAIDRIYRTLCVVLYNFVPMSGHPGGSISSGRIVEGLLYATMDYDLSHPDREDADALVYAAGHKALGLYAMWALRNELVRQIDPGLLPPESRQLRFEDLLGFRRNPTNDTPLFKKFRAKALDGHPTPATPYVRLATGASGVGTASGFGLALAARDYYGKNAPRIHVLEGEGGMTPGRVSEAMAAAASAQLDNLVLHVDWNQASIDTDRVCRDGEAPGDYVQWNPLELARLHDFNVIYVRNGHSFPHVLAAQALAESLETTQPTAIVYRTVKGWNYGITGRASHGAGHKFASEGYYKCLACEFEDQFHERLPRVESKVPSPAELEAAYWDTLLAIREVLSKNREIARWAEERIRRSLTRLEARARRPREGAPTLERLYDGAALVPARTPEAITPKPGEVTTLRGQLGAVLNHLNRLTGGGLLVAAADLLDSTSVSKADDGFPGGFFNAQSNPGSRLVAVGGICEDAMGGVMTGVSSFGRHVGVTSSYGAFIAALEHVAVRLHAIGQQARNQVTGEPYRPVIMVNAHAGAKTGEDGPTHADPQALQLLQENFPAGTAITLTPWEPQEIWPLVAAGLAARPAVLAPFVTRPNETVPDRRALGLAPADAAAKGIYKLVAADPTRRRDGTLVLQGSEVTIAFTAEVLPWIRERGLNLDVYYVASAELFGLLPAEEQRRIFPEEQRVEAMGITGFTLPTLYRWVRSEDGLARSLHPFRKGRYLGSGQWPAVLKEGGLDGRSQIEAIAAYCAARSEQSES